MIWKKMVRMIVFGQIMAGIWACGYDHESSLTIVNLSNVNATEVNINGGQLHKTFMDLNPGGSLTINYIGHSEMSLDVVISLSDSTTITQTNCGYTDQGLYSKDTVFIYNDSLQYKYHPFVNRLTE